MKYSSLFLATVIQTYPKRKDDTNKTSANINRDAYTIDVQPVVSRLPLKRVRVLSPVAGNASGFVWLPNIGDWVICAYLEEFKGQTICLGAIKHPAYNKITEEANQYQDCTLSHQSGSWIRMRDLEKGENPSSTKSRSEVVLHHKTGSEIELTEPEMGQSEINITHASGTKINIDVDGNLNIDVLENTVINGKDLTITAENVKITDKSTIIGDENTATGIHNQLNHPVCFFTGAPFDGSPTNKCS